jgi:uncharacterized protein YbjT (DUF2867 family)
MMDTVRSDKRYTALVAGATGLVGSALLEQLLGDGDCSSITVIARSEAPAGLVQAAGANKLRWFGAGLDRLEESLKGVQADRVFCALGTTIKQAKTREAFRRVDLEYPLALGRWAERNGAQALVVVTAMGASERSSFFYNRVKGEAERLLSSLTVPNIVFLRPSLLLGVRSEYRRGEQWSAKVTERAGFLFAGPLRRYEPIEGKSVAAAMRYAASEAAQGRLGPDHDLRARVVRRSKAWATERHANGVSVTVLESDAIAYIAREISR